MSSRPDLTDRNSLLLHRARARRRAGTGGDAMFLHHLAIDELQQRLELVNTSFTHIALIAPFAEIWGPAFPGAHLVGDDDILDLTPGGYDLIIHAMGLHWANDPVGQLIQCRRALRPDGLFLGALFGGRTLEELRSCLAESESALCGGMSPRVLPMGEIRDLGALLQRAGFALPVADSHAQRVEYSALNALIADLRAMGETNALAARTKTRPPRGFFDHAQALYQTHFGGENGRIRATFETIFLTGWAPDPSQQQPLRPGSATARLSDALGVEEQPLRDKDGRAPRIDPNPEPPSCGQTPSEDS